MNRNKKQKQVNYREESSTDSEEENDEIIDSDSDGNPQYSQQKGDNSQR